MPVERHHFLPVGSSGVSRLPTFLAFFGRGRCRLGHWPQRCFFHVSPRSGTSHAASPWGRRSRIRRTRARRLGGRGAPGGWGWAAGAGRAAEPRGPGAGLGAGLGAGSSRAGAARWSRRLRARLRKPGRPFPLPPPCLPEASAGFAGAPGPGRAAAPAPGAGPQGLAAAPGPLGLLALGEGRGRRGSRLLLRLRGGLRAGRSACAVTWPCGARAACSRSGHTACEPSGITRPPREVKAPGRRPRPAR